MTHDIKAGTFIDGIAASEHLDTSGERIMIDGVDISSLASSGVLNFEHSSKEASQIVGKILEAKKIFNEDDCENERHRHFWEKCKLPYIYIMGELFDGVGHQGAKEVAAMLRYDELNKPVDPNHKKLINFSIEGSRLQTEGGIVKKCIARKVSITIIPCNKICEAEEFKKDNPQSLVSLTDLFRKSEDTQVELYKAERRFFVDKQTKEQATAKKTPYKNISQLSPSQPETHRPSKPVSVATKPEAGSTKWATGERISYAPRKEKLKTGAKLYGDPEFWKKDEIDTEDSVRKKIVKSIKNKLVEKNDKAEKDDKVEKNDISFSLYEAALKALAEEAFASFEKKEELIQSIRQKYPEWNDSEVLSMAKTYSYVQLKKKEAILFKLMKNKNLEKSKEKDKPFHGYNKKKHSPTGGLNAKFREKYNRETGSNLQAPVTEKNPTGKDAARKKSFCARMGGVSGPTSKDGQLTPKGAALKRWRCSKSEEIDTENLTEEQKKELEKMDKNRCWEGYEPTPNKKPYSKGSCRKKTFSKNEDE